MKLSYYPQQYKCGACQKVQSHYVWSNEIEKTKHRCECGCEVNVCDIYEPEVNDSFIMIKTPTANRVRQASRKKRNLDHFKKQVYPTLKRGSQEQHHFAKKHKLK